MKKPRLIPMDDPRFIDEFLKALSDPECMRERTPEELKEIYAAIKEQLTPEQLEKEFSLDSWEGSEFLENIIASLAKEQEELDRKRDNQ